MMAKRVAARSKRGRARATRDTRELGDTALSIVRVAADLLDKEMAIGIKAAKAVQKRLHQERRIEAADFREALAKFHADGRDLINSLDHQLSGDLLNKNVTLAKSFVAKTNEMLDLAVGVVTTGAELANQLLQTNLTKQDAGPGRKSRR
jgi:hypothetical protein